VLDNPLTIFGDGKQVRDVLYIDDLINCYETIITKPEIATGQIINIGGGPERSISLLDLIAMLEEFRGRPMTLFYEDWRPGDQRVYISNVRKAERLLGWRPTVSVQDGVRRLYDWAITSQPLIMALNRS
jgi:CDP-paratose 2-epimerase